MTLACGTRAIFCIAKTSTGACAFASGGGKILFVPAARITHALGACSKDRRVFVEWHKHKGMMRFYRKFFGQQYSRLLMGLVATGVWFRFALLATYYTARRCGRACRRA
jgi:GT2 family glycosyltransferase